MSRQIGLKQQKYSPEILEEAAGLNAASFKYGEHRVGHNTVLAEDEERRIADLAIHMARIGYRGTRQELANTVKKILDDNGRTNLFKDNKPGKEWLSGFFRRHPELSLRTPIQSCSRPLISQLDGLRGGFATGFKIISFQQVIGAKQ
ncbi:hypothetical protein MAR_001618, partial [Mya arenaria]